MIPTFITNRFFICFAVFFFFSISLWAEEITLLGGTKITGDVVEEDNARLVIRINAGPGGPKNYEIRKDQIMGRGQEMSSAEGQNRVGLLKIALRHVSKYRFFWSAGILLISLIILLSTTHTATRRAFGTLCIFAIVALIYYYGVGVSIPKLAEDHWKGPTPRLLGIKSVKLWESRSEENSLLVIRECNFLGPWNKITLDGFLNQMIQDQIQSDSQTDIKVYYGKSFVSNRILWKTASVDLKNGKTLYVWVSEFKQYRVGVVLILLPSSVQKKENFSEAETLVRKFK